ncbi:MAG: type III pantothenate kinase [Rikenellaceae bacterium]
MVALVIDEGNSLTKISIMSQKDNIDRTWRVKYLNVDVIVEFLANTVIDSAIYCSVKDKNLEVVEFLNQKNLFFIDFDISVPIPIEINYTTPYTLGTDRVAAAIGAGEIFHGENLLVVDLGSAITIDFIENGSCFKGGNITAGARLRYKSLSDFTDKLPRYVLPERDDFDICSSSTREAIENGVALGIVCELEGYISRYRELYPDLKIIFTGGDAKYFADKFKIAIFANCELVNIGLYKVLKYNNVKTENK